MSGYPSNRYRHELNSEELVRIIADAKKDDTDALVKLCKHVYERVYGYFFYRVREPEEADNLTGEVIFKMVKALKAQHGNFLAWIYKIAGNTLIDLYRKRSERHEISIDESQMDVPDQKADFANGIIARQKLKNAMANLTKEQADVINFRLVQGYSNEETAKIMGKSVGAVKVLQYRAIKSLRDYYRKKGYEIKD